MVRLLDEHYAVCDEGLGGELGQLALFLAVVVDYGGAEIFAGWRQEHSGDLLDADRVELDAIQVVNLPLRS